LKQTSLYFTAPGRVALETSPLPAPARGEILVRTLISAISPGTEMLIYRGQAPADMPVDETLPALQGDFRFPLKYGYSAVGEVIQLGQGVSGDWQGKLVFSFHPHESHFRCSPEDLLPVPPGVKLEDAAFLPNMETAVNFLMDGKPAIGEQVVVFGQGVVGLLTAALLAKMPLASLVTVDRYPARRRRSVNLGATASLDPDEPDALSMVMSALQDGREYAGADLAYELSGNPEALDMIVAAAGFNGRIVIGSWYGKKESKLHLGGRFHRHRIRLVSSQVSTIGPQWSGRWNKSRRLEVAWSMLRQMRPSHLITHRFPIGQAAKAYEMLDQNPEEAVQVMLTYQD
jgi:2-desacetyl-2-hydroxyethyl bacteriochlorophyllide A dehydrogenase